MRKVNRESDFELTAAWVGDEGITPFILEYSVGTRKVIASWDGNTWKNCEKLDDKHIQVFFDQHHFGCGALQCKLTYYIKNERYTDGNKKVSIPLETNVVIIDGPSDDVITDIVMQVAPNYQRGLSAFEIAQKNGFEGTEEEWLESLKAYPSAAPISLEGDDILVIGDKKFKLTPYTEEVEDEPIEEPTE